MVTVQNVTLSPVASSPSSLVRPPCTGITLGLCPAPWSGDLLCGRNTPPALTPHGTDQAPPPRDRGTGMSREEAEWHGEVEAPPPHRGRNPTSAGSLHWGRQVVTGLNTSRQRHPDFIDAVNPGTKRPLSGEAAAFT